MGHFENAFRATMWHEGFGKLTDSKIDPGGETYSGISRVYWPDWEGWEYIDKGERPPEIMVENFYRVNFWNRIQGDTLAEIAPEVACEVFDTAVNVGVNQAVKFLQTAHNIADGYRYELEVDGLLGPKTIETIRRYLTMQPGTPEINEEILLNCCNGEQYIFYKQNPNHKRFRGWFRRV